MWSTKLKTLRRSSAPTKVVQPLSIPTPTSSSTCLQTSKRNTIKSISSTLPQRIPTWGSVLKISAKASLGRSRTLSWSATTARKSSAVAAYSEFTGANAKARKWSSFRVTCTIGSARNASSSLRKIRAATIWPASAATNSATSAGRSGPQLITATTTAKEECSPCPIQGEPCSITRSLPAATASAWMKLWEESVPSSWNYQFN